AVWPARRTGLGAAVGLGAVSAHACLVSRLAGPPPAAPVAHAARGTSPPYHYFLADTPGMRRGRGWFTRTAPTQGTRARRGLSRAGPRVSPFGKPSLPAAPDRGRGGAASRRTLDGLAHCRRRTPARRAPVGGVRHHDSSGRAGCASAHGGAAGFD